MTMLSLRPKKFAHPTFLAYWPIHSLAQTAHASPLPNLTHTFPAITQIDKVCNIVVI